MDGLTGESIFHAEMGRSSHLLLASSLKLPHLRFGSVNPMQSSSFESN